MIGLIDCNNFFVSCERSFNPLLHNKPVIVLSNNDGCVVAMSNEAKNIGIKRGVPYFKISDIVEQNNVYVFSSNYQLYSDLSSRIMTILSSFVDDVEIYSIDEAFIHIPNDNLINLRSFAEKISSTIYKCTGVPVSVGIAPTKTLAKLAVLKAKEESTNSIYLIDTESKRVDVLSQTPISKIWGIGRNIVPQLHKLNIKNAIEFSSVPYQKFHNKLNLTLTKIWNELNGTAAIQFEPISADRQSICCSRSFSIVLTEYSELLSVLTKFAEDLVLKLQQQNDLIMSISVFIHPDNHKKDMSQYCNSSCFSFNEATSNLGNILDGIEIALKNIYRKGYSYKKAGIIAHELVKPTPDQANLFTYEEKNKLNKIQAVISSINESQSSVDKIHFATYITNKRPIKRNMKSKLYSTNFNEIIEINCNIK